MNASNNQTLKLRSNNKFISTRGSHYFRQTNLINNANIQPLNKGSTSQNTSSGLARRIWKFGIRSKSINEIHASRKLKNIGINLSDDNDIELKGEQNKFFNLDQKTAKQKNGKPCFRFVKNPKETKKIFNPKKHVEELKKVMQLQVKKSGYCGHNIDDVPSTTTSVVSPRDSRNFKNGEEVLLFFNQLKEKNIIGNDEYTKYTKYLEEFKEKKVYVFDEETIQKSKKPIDNPVINQFVHKILGDYEHLNSFGIQLKTKEKPSVIQFQEQMMFSIQQQQEISFIQQKYQNNQF